MMSLATFPFFALFFVALPPALGTTNNDTTTGGGCSDPLAAILETLHCVEQKDVVCASSGYNADVFVKLHNGIDTNTTIDAEGDFWSGVFALTDIHLDINYMHNNTGPNQASLRYVEIVTFTNGTSLGLPEASFDYPFGQTFLQHEHALVTVGDDCKMILWDQYGDNQEQSIVDETSLAILCIVGALPVETCSAAEAGSETMVEAYDAEPYNGASSASALLLSGMMYLSALLVMSVVY